MSLFYLCNFLVTLNYVSHEDIHHLWAECFVLLRSYLLWAQDGDWSSRKFQRIFFMRFDRKQTLIKLFKDHFISKSYFCLMEKARSWWVKLALLKFDWSCWRIGMKMIEVPVNREENFLEEHKANFLVSKARMFGGNALHDRFDTRMDKFRVVTLCATGSLWICGRLLVSN